jgi:hypothetical protein
MEITKKKIYLFSLLVSLFTACSQAEDAEERLQEEMDAAEIVQESSNITHSK